MNEQTKNLMLTQSQQLGEIFEVLGVAFATHYLFKITFGDKLEIEEIPKILSSNQLKEYISSELDCYGPILTMLPTDYMNSQGILERIGVYIKREAIYASFFTGEPDARVRLCRFSNIPTPEDYTQTIIEVCHRALAREILIKRLEALATKDAEWEECVERVMYYLDKGDVLGCAGFIHPFADDSAIQLIFSSTPHWQDSDEQRQPFVEAVDRGFGEFMPKAIINLKGE